MALEKMSNKGIIGAAGIPDSDKGFAVSRLGGGGGRFNPAGRKRREENELGRWEVMFRELSGGGGDESTASRKSGAISQATSTRRSGKGTIWRRADTSTLTLTLMLASLRRPQKAGLNY